MLGNGQVVLILNPVQLVHREGPEIAMRAPRAEEAPLVVEEKYLRVANYANNMNREIDMIAHSCGVRHARELKREHVRIVQASGQSVAMNMLYPYPEIKARMKVA